MIRIRLKLKTGLLKVERPQVKTGRKTIALNSKHQ